MVAQKGHTVIVSVTAWPEFYNKEAQEKKYFDYKLIFVPLFKKKESVGLYQKHL